METTSSAQFRPIKKHPGTDHRANLTAHERFASLLEIDASFLKEKESDCAILLSSESKQIDKENAFWRLRDSSPQDVQDKFQLDKEAMVDGLPYIRFLINNKVVQQMPNDARIYPEGLSDDTKLPDLSEQLPSLAPITIEEIQTSQEKVIARLTDHANNVLAMVSSKPVDFTQQFDEIRKGVHEFSENPALLTSDHVKAINNYFVAWGIIKAVANNDSDTAKQFLTSLSDINRSKLANSLLFLCLNEVKGEDALIRIFELLSDIKANFNCFNSQKRTPLVVAMQLNCSDAIVNKLIALGAAVNKANAFEGKPALQYAAAYKIDVHRVELLLNAGVNKDTVGKTMAGVIQKRDYLTRILNAQGGPYTQKDPERVEEMQRINKIIEMLNSYVLSMR